MFFGLAFAGTGLPWITWGLGDLGAKAAMALLLLLPFRALMGRATRSSSPPAKDRQRELQQQGPLQREEVVVRDQVEQVRPSRPARAPRSPRNSR